MTIKVFVATTDTQGQRANDFCFVPEGELLMPGAFECTEGTVDDACGCKRDLVGVTCLKGTTTMRVVERDGNDHALAEAFYDALKRGGWLERWDEESTRSVALDNARYIIEAAFPFQVGMIVERRDTRFGNRKPSLVAFESEPHVRPTNGRPQSSREVPRIKPGGEATMRQPLMEMLEMYATVLGNPATVSMERVEERGKARFVYIYRTGPTSRRTVIGSTPMEMLCMAYDALAAGSYPAFWRWQAASNEP